MIQYKTVCRRNYYKKFKNSERNHTCTYSEFKKVALKHNLWQHISVWRKLRQLLISPYSNQILTEGSAEIFMENEIITEVNYRYPKGNSGF